MPPHLHRRRLRDLLLATTLSIPLSIIPFAEGFSNATIITPPPLRSAFLSFIALSWPCSLSCLLLCFIFHHNPNTPVLLSTVIAAPLSFAAFSLLLFAQIIWTYVAARGQHLWLLALVVLGLAVLVVILASVAITFSHAVAILYAQRGDAEEHKSLDTPRRHETVLRIDPDTNSPQKVVATIPSKDSELAF